MGVDRVVHASLDSTNAEAVRVAPTLAAPTWILALHQTAARGRRGRAWVNPQGNFAATLVMRPEGPMQDWALRSFTASLALAESVGYLTGRPEALSLKWPNDVLLNGGKLAGILLETSGPSLAIGIGVNLTSAPTPQQVEEGAVPPVSLQNALSVDIRPVDLLDTLAPAFARWEHRLTTHGFAPIRTAWLARAARLGQPIRAITGPTTHHGIFRDVDAKGQLVLQTPEGPQTIPAADVHF